MVAGGGGDGHQVPGPNFEGRVCEGHPVGGTEGGVLLGAEGIRRGAGRWGTARAGNSDPLVCVRLDEPLVLDKVEELRADRDAAQGLPLVSFIARDRRSRGRLAGKGFYASPTSVSKRPGRCIMPCLTRSRSSVPSSRR